MIPSKSGVTPRWEEVLLLARVADLAYETNSLARAVRAMALGFAGVKSIENKKTDTEVLVVWGIERVVIAPRGTEPEKWLRGNFRDLGHDLMAWREKIPAIGHVHAGFARAAGSVWGEVFATAKELVQGGRSLVLTGHSLGGAIAGILAARMTMGNLDVEGIAVFGMPRTFTRGATKKFRAAFPGWIVRVRNNGDIVARLPPALPVLGNWSYWHIAEKDYFDRDGRYWPKIPWWRTAADRTVSFFEGIAMIATRGKLRFSPIADHGMAEEGGYIPVLERHVAGLRKAG